MPALCDPPGGGWKAARRHCVSSSKCKRQAPKARPAKSKRTPSGVRIRIEMDMIAFHIVRPEAMHGRRLRDDFIHGLFGLLPIASGACGLNPRPGQHKGGRV